MTALLWLWRNPLAAACIALALVAAGCGVLAYHYRGAYLELQVDQQRQVARAADSARRAAQEQAALGLDAVSREHAADLARLRSTEAALRRMTNATDRPLLPGGRAALALGELRQRVGAQGRTAAPAAP